MLFRTEPMTFCPTMDELADLSSYIGHMESKGAHRAGIAKIVLPKEWVGRKKGYNPAEMEGIQIKPVQQDIVVTKVEGAFKTIADRFVFQHQHQFLLPTYLNIFNKVPPCHLC